MCLMCMIILINLFPIWLSRACTSHDKMLIVIPLHIDPNNVNFLSIINFHTKT